MDLDQLLQIAQADQGLKQAQKDELFKYDKERLTKLLAGAAGAALVLSVTKYLKLSKTTQVLLSIAGFGAGMLIYNFFTQDKFAPYDDRSGTYKIDTKRF